MLYSKLNSNDPKFTFCVDGRKCVAILRIDRTFGEYTHYKLGKMAEQVNGPQFLGGGLMFVAYLMDVYGLTMESAFEFADLAIRNAGLEPAIHIDTHHSALENVRWSYPLLPSNLIDLITTKIKKGCGYAFYAFGELADQVIAMAIKFGWTILILDGKHLESKAGLNMHPEYSLNTSRMVEENQMAFNLDISMAMNVLYELYRVLPKDLILSTLPKFGFRIWVVRHYRAVVKSLRNIDELIVHNPLITEPL